MKKVKILNKSFSKPISCLTAYSPSIAKILDGKIDLITTVSIHLGSILALILFLYKNNLKNKSFNTIMLSKISFLGSLPIFLAGVFFYDYRS